MSSSKGEKQELKGETNQMLNTEGKGDIIQEKVPLYLNSGGNKDLSAHIRNSMMRLDMLIYLDRKEEAQAEIQEISQQLKKMGI